MGWMSLPQPTKKMRSIETHHEINGRIYRFRAYDFIREVVKRWRRKLTRSFAPPRKTVCERTTIPNTGAP